MNRFLAFAFVVAMTVATVLGVKLQGKTREMEAEIRRLEREGAAKPASNSPSLRSTQEMRRLEAELQLLRNQMATQRDTASENLRTQIDLLVRENTALQNIISNQIIMAARMQSAGPTVIETPVETPVVEEVEEDPGIGMGVVNMNEFRLMRWRQGTLPTEGAAVIDLIPGGTAGAAGLQLGDIITSIDGEPVDGSAMLDERLAQMAPGQVTTLVLDRNRTEVVVQLMIPLEPETAGE